MKTGTSGNVSEHHRRGREVDRRHPHEHRDGHDRGEHDLRQVPREVRLEPVDALDGGRRHLARLDPVERERLVAEPALDQSQAQLGEDRRGGAPARQLEAPREHSPAREGQCQQHEIARDVVQRGAGKGPCDDTREQGRLEEHERRGGAAEDDVETEQAANRPGPAHEPLVENAHAQPAGEPLVGGASASPGASTSSPPIRARKTWYVQPW